jgi:hypothetical protein
VKPSGLVVTAVAAESVSLETRDAVLLVVVRDAAERVVSPSPRTKGVPVGLVMPLLEGVRVLKVSDVRLPEPLLSRHL